MASIVQCYTLVVTLACCWAHAEQEGVIPPVHQLPNQYEDDVSRCYGTWGCLPMGGPFTSVFRPVNLLPIHPDMLKVHFLLMTRADPDHFRKLKTKENSSFADSFFDATRPVKFIVHGYLEHGSQPWIKNMIRELLTKDSFNVISVDWVFGAAPPYTQAVANARMVGIVLGDFIKHLEDKYSVPLSDIHVIGHSLGAHVAGYAGEKILGLGRITGLDPAEPYFQYTDPKVRLDPTDANFVDVIHTDGGSIIRGGLGMIQDCGHVDFYPNGGKRQPGCDESVIGSIEKAGIYNDEEFWPLDISETIPLPNTFSSMSWPAGIRRYIGCNHLRAYELFTESINNECLFYGYVCDSFHNFTSGNCPEGCGEGKALCARMGYHSDEWKPFAGPEPIKMFLETGNTQPFCRHHYLIRMINSDTKEAKKHGEQKGKLLIHLSGSKGQTPVVDAKKELVQFTPGRPVEFLVSWPDLGKLLRVDLEWLSKAHFLNPLRVWRRMFDTPSVFVNRFIITSLETGDKTVFCGTDEPQPPEKVRVLFTGTECTSLPGGNGATEVENNGETDVDNAPPADATPSALTTDEP